MLGCRSNMWATLYAFMPKLNCCLGLIGALSGGVVLSLRRVPTGNTPGGRFMGRAPTNQSPKLVKTMALGEEARVYLKPEFATLGISCDLPE